MDNSDQKGKRAEGTPTEREGDAGGEIERPGGWRWFLDEVKENALDAAEAFADIRKRIALEFLPRTYPRRSRQVQTGYLERAKLVAVPHQPHVEAFAKGLANLEHAKALAIRPIQGKEVVPRFRNVLVVGGMDFFGAALVDRLNAVDFEEITVTDSLSDEVCRRLPSLGFREFLAPEEFAEMARGRFHGLAEYSHVFYLGGWKPETMARTKSLLASAAKAGARFVAVSPASSMGGRLPADIEERHDPRNFRPLTESGVLSCLFDRHALAKHIGRNYISLKHYQLFGRGENGTLGGLVKSCHSQLRSAGSIRMPAALGPDTPAGRRKYDFFPVEDAARIALFLAQSHLAEGIYELGSGTSATPEELARTVVAAAGSDVPIAWDKKLACSPPPPEPEFASLEKLEETGWKPLPFDLRESVSRYISNSQNIETSEDEPAHHRETSKKVKRSHSAISPKKINEDSAAE